MNIQKINSTPVQNTSFTSLKKGCIPDYVFAGIKDAPALKNFGKDYDAYGSMGTFLSSKKEGREQLSLNIDAIVPKSLKAKVLSKLSLGEAADIVVVKTHATNSKDFITAIWNRSSSLLERMYKNPEG